MSEAMYAGHKCEGSNCNAIVYVASMKRCGNCTAKSAQANVPHTCAHEGCSVKVIGHELCRAHYAQKRQAETKAYEAARKAFAESPEGKRAAMARAIQQATEDKTRARNKLWEAYKAGQLTEDVRVITNGAQVILIKDGRSETYVDRDQLEVARAEAAKKAAEARNSSPKPASEKKVSKEDRKAAKQKKAA